jgi:hypothetical protein
LATQVITFDDATARRGKKLLINFIQLKRPTLRDPHLRRPHPVLSCKNEAISGSAKRRESTPRI